MILPMLHFSWTFAGYPKAITSAMQTLSVCLNCSITIPSNLHVSALDAQDITWSRIILGVIEEVDNAIINQDYSLTLTDVGRIDATSYFAMATNTEGMANGPQVELVVIEKPCESILYLVFYQAYIIELIECHMHIHNAHHTLPRLYIAFSQLSVW